MLMGLSSGQLLRRARTNADLSQTEVARRAGVAQSVVSAYEAGHRQPSLATLATLIEATGHRLVTSLQRIEDAPRGLPATRVGRLLRQRRRAIMQLAGSRGGSNVRVFGSVARGEDFADSDIDLLIDLAPRTGLFTLMALRAELEELLGRSVDLVPAGGLKPHLAGRVEHEAIPL